MSFAIKRLTSPNLQDKFYGVLFYIFWASIFGLIAFIIEFYNQINLFGWLSIASASLFILTTLPSVSDFGGVISHHKGTIMNFVSDINPPKPSLIHYLVILDEKEGEDMFALVSMIIGIIAMIVSIAASCSKGSPLYFILFASNIFFFYCSYLLSKYGVYKSKVDADTLAKFYNLENINIENKEFFKEVMLETYKRNGIVRKKDVMDFCSRLVEEYKEEKRNEKKYKDKHEYERFSQIPVKKTIVLEKE